MNEHKYRNIAEILIRFSLPLIASGALQQLYNWVDAFIVGHYVGEDALAAVGSIGTVTLCMVLVITGFTQGLSLHASTKYGEQDYDALHDILQTFFKVLVPLFVVIAVIGFAVSTPLLHLLDTPDNMFGFAFDYLRIIFIGVPFLTIYNLYAAMLRAIGNSKVPFYAVLVSAISNIIMDILFVIVFHWGVVGAAIATILAQFAMMVYIVGYTQLRQPLLCWDPARGKDFHALRGGFKFAMPLTIQSSINAVGNFILQGFMNSFGSHTVAAVTSAYRIDSVLMLPLLNVGSAIGTKVAQSRGEGNELKMQQFSHVGTAICAVIAILLSLLMHSCGGVFVRLFGVEQVAAEIGSRFFANLSMYYLFFGLSCALRGAIEGRGKVIYTSIVGIVSLLLRIGLSYGTVHIFGNMTIAHAEGISWIFLVLCLLGYFVWQKIRGRQA